MAWWGWICVLLLVIIVVIFLLRKYSLRFVPEKEKWIIERFGKYKATWKPGMHWKIPIVDRIVKKVVTLEQMKDFAPQSVVTKDKMVVKLDSVVFYRVENAHKFVYAADDPLASLEKITSAIFRDFIAKRDFDEAMSSRSIINKEVTKALNDEVRARWGIEIVRVEMKTIEPPADILEAVKKRKVAEQQKQAQILEAEGQARSIELVQKANADAIALLKDAGADESVLALKGFETLAKVADGKATKIIIPSELQNVAGTIQTIAEVASGDTRKKSAKADGANLDIPLPEKQTFMVFPDQKKDGKTEAKKTEEKKPAEKKAEEEKDKKSPIVTLLP